MTQDRLFFFQVSFVAAAAYNLMWGALVAIAPRVVMPWLPTDHATTVVAQGLALCIAAYGAAYALVAWRPLRFWPFIAIGLAAKIIGPIGWLNAVSRGWLPTTSVWVIVFNDLIWWPSFAGFLFVLWRTRNESAR